MIHLLHHLPSAILARLWPDLADRVTLSVRVESLTKQAREQEARGDEQEHLAILARAGWEKAEERTTRLEGQLVTADQRASRFKAHALRLGKAAKRARCGKDELWAAHVRRGEQCDALQDALAATVEERDAFGETVQALTADLANTAKAFDLEKADHRAQVEIAEHNHAEAEEACQEWISKVTALEAKLTTARADAVKDAVACLGSNAVSWACNGHGREAIRQIEANEQQIQQAMAGRNGTASSTTTDITIDEGTV